MPRDAAVPEHPYLKPWYRTAIHDGGVALEHAGRVVAFDGAGAVKLLPRLLPLLDGTRGVGEIVASIGAPVEPAIRRALELLAEHDLLLDGSGGNGRVSDATDRFLSWVAGGAVPTCTDDLATTRVLVSGSGRLAEPVARALRHAGLEVVRGGSLDAAAIVVAAPSDTELDTLAGWNAALLEEPTRPPLLPVRAFNGRVAGIGPFIVPGETCCWECFRIRIAANLPDPDAAAHVEDAPTPDFGFPPLDELIAAVASLVVLRWVLRSDPELPGTYWTIAVAPMFAIGEHRVYRVPRCAACSSAASRAAPLPWFKEDPSHGARVGAA